MSVMIGSRIGQYRVLRLLGEGGMGRVLLVEHAVIGSRHALKMLHPELTSNDMIVQRFLNEARAASSIGHRNVIEISHVDQVEGGGPWYLVMKYLEGQTLASLLAHGPLRDQRLILHLACEALNGLQAAHDRRIVHRDLKPDNLFVTTAKGDPYRVVVLDFGVAQLGQDARVGTRTGAVIGTPQYMAAEQHRGAAIDHRADVFAMGAILYEMIAGRLPFEDDSAPRSGLSGPEIFHRMMTRPVADPRLFQPTLTEGFARAVLQALETEPRQRHASARAFALALAEATPGGRDGPSGLELLAMYADELLPGGAPREPAASPRRWIDAPTLKVVPDAPVPWPTVAPPGAVGPMSTLGASASQASGAVAATRAPRGIGRLIAIGLGVLVLAAVVTLVVLKRSAPSVTVARDDASRAASVTEATVSAPTPAISITAPPDAPSPDAPLPDARPPDAGPPDAAPPPDASPVAPPPDAPPAAPLPAAPPPDPPAPSTRPPRPPSVAPTGTGQLSIVVLPWAEVWVDGKAYGQTPRSISLQAGAHRVRLKNDAQEKTVTVTVINGKTTKIDESWP